MNKSLPYHQELKDMRDNIRRSVNALEMCEVCERVCECEQRVIGDILAWMCDACLAKNSSQAKKPIQEPLPRSA